jgi:hypothetical protein
MIDLRDTRWHCFGPAASVQEGIATYKMDLRIPRTGRYDFGLEDGKLWVRMRPVDRRKQIRF